MGWLIAFGILFLLAILPLGASVKYNADGPLIRIIGGPIRLTVFPRKKKDKKENKPKKERKISKKIKFAKKCLIWITVLTVIFTVAQYASFVLTGVEQTVLIEKWFTVVVFEIGLLMFRTVLKDKKKKNTDTEEEQ